MTRKYSSSSSFLDEGVDLLANLSPEEQAILDDVRMEYVQEHFGQSSLNEAESRARPSNAFLQKSISDASLINTMMTDPMKGI